MQMKVGSQQWGETDDHSKWALAGDSYICVGDMNRMQSQWKRGAFYCLTDKNLISAVNATILEVD